MIKFKDNQELIKRRTIKFSPENNMGLVGNAQNLLNNIKITPRNHGTWINKNQDMLASMLNKDMRVVMNHKAIPQEDLSIKIQILKHR